MLSKSFLDRPVFAWVIAIFIMLLGALGIYNLPIAQYPNIAPPTIARMPAWFGGVTQGFRFGLQGLCTRRVNWTP